MDIKPIKDEMIERTVIASALINGSALHELTSRLTDGSFYNHNHKKIVSELMKLPSKGAEVDLSLLSSKLGENFYGLLGDLVTNASTSAKITNHCKKLKDIENARNLAQRALEVVSKACNVNDYSNYVSWGLDHVTSFYDGVTGVSELEHIRNHIPEATQGFDDVVNGRIKVLLTGISDIDSSSGGFRGGEYVVIAGRPSQGKSSLGLSIIKNIASKGKRIGLFSIEMTANQNIFKLTSMMSGTDSNGERLLPFGVFRGTIKPTKAHQEAYKTACQNLSSQNIYVNTCSYSTISDIENELRRFCKVNGLDGFVLDYIGLVGDESDKNQKNFEKVAKISERIRVVIKELQVVGFVLVQLNRDSHNKKPSMANLADSTQIERDAHFVYLIHQPDLENKKEKVIICDKGRDGGEGNYPTHFCTQTTEFTSMSKYDGEEYMERLKSGSVQELF